MGNYAIKAASVPR